MLANIAVETCLLLSVTSHFIALYYLIQEPMHG